MLLCESQPAQRRSASLQTEEAAQKENAFMNMCQMSRWSKSSEVQGPASVTQVITGTRWHIRPHRETCSSFRVADVQTVVFLEEKPLGY